MRFRSSSLLSVLFRFLSSCWRHTCRRFSSVLREMLTPDSSSMIRSMSCHVHVAYSSRIRALWGSRSMAGRAIEQGIRNSVVAVGRSCRLEMGMEWKLCNAELVALVTTLADSV